MFQTRDSFITKLNLFTQLVLSVCSLWLTIGLVHTFIAPVDYTSMDFRILSLGIAFLWYIGLRKYNLGRVFRLRSYGSLLAGYVKMIISYSALLISVLFLSGQHQISQWVLLCFPVVNIAVLFGYQLVFYHTLKGYREKGRNVHSAVLMGGKSLLTIVAELEEAGDLGIKVVGICTDSSTVKEKYEGIYPIYERCHDIAALMDQHHIDEIIYSGKTIDRLDVAEKVALCQELGIVFRLQSEFLNIKGMESEISFINNAPFLTYLNVPSNSDALGIKVIIDFLMSLAGLLVISPFMFIIALIVKLGDGGPVLFSQIRVGKNGRKFHCYKFRTMVTNAEDLKKELMDQNEQEGPVFKITKDPRVTKVGHFLRKTSLDELPQFFNVIKGDMAIVGPRPPLPDEVEQYQRWHRRRLSMKPGITCIWQTSGRNNIPFEQWMEMDLQYIDSWSLKLDAQLILRTVKTVVVGDGK